MNLKQTKYELQNIISGEGSSSYDSLIQTIAHYLRSGKRASPMAEEKHQNKAEEAKQLIAFAHQHQLFYDNIDSEQFISSGAEQKVVAHRPIFLNYKSIYGKIYSNQRNTIALP